MAVGLIPCLCFSQISLRVFGGMSHSRSKDICTSVEAANELLDLYDPGHRGYYQKLCCGAHFGGELSYRLSENFSLGIGFEFIRLRNENDLSYNVGTPTHLTTIFAINAYPLTLNVHYFLPVTNLLKAFVTVGAGYYFLDLDYSEDTLWETGSLVDDSSRYYTFQSERGTLGVQIRLGFEIFVSNTLSFFIEGTGRLARFSEIEGNWTSRGHSPVQGDFGKSGSSHYFWYYEDIIEGKNYAVTAFREAAPEDALNARKGEIYLSGLSFTAGIKVGLNFKKK